MIQDTTASKLSEAFGLKVDFNRGRGDKKRGYHIVGGAYLGADAASARRTLQSVVEVRRLADDLTADATNWMPV